MPSIDIAPNLVSELSAVGLKPTDVVLYINSQCNLRCKHCYVGNPLLDEALYYSLPSILGFLSDLPALDRVTVLGGEPFYHPRLVEIVEAFGQHPCTERRITTNLTIRNTQIFDALRVARFRICVSLDGHTAELHEQIRGKGSFQPTLENLTYILVAGHDVEITHTLTSDNISSFWSFVDLCKSIGVEHLNLHRLSMRGNALDNRNLDVSPTDWRKLTEGIEARSIKSGKPLRVRYEVGFATHNEYMRLILTGAYQHHAQGSFYSSKGGGRLVIFPNKKIFISSEAFGTDSYIGDFELGFFRVNHSPKNELFAAKQTPYSTSSLNPEIVGDANYPVPLSVSFRRTVDI